MGYQRERRFHDEDGAGFKEQATRHGVDSVRDGRGVALADFDNDGRIDLFVANANSEPYLYRNTQTTGNHWAQFLLEGTKSNRSAVGAQVRLKIGRASCRERVEISGVGVSLKRKVGGQ